jgi:hypothetical protein
VKPAGSVLRAFSFGGLAEGSKAMLLQDPALETELEVSTP